MTSNDFSKRIELRGSLAYGLQDERFKVRTGLRYFVNKDKSKKERDEISQRSKAVGNLIRLRNLTEQRNSNKKGKEKES